MKTKNKEDLNFIKRLKNPQFLLQTGSYWTKVSASRLFKKVGKALTAHAPQQSDYPVYLKDIYAKGDLAATHYEKGFLTRFVPTEPAKDIDITGRSFAMPDRIELATRKMQCSGFPEWSGSFEDEENLLALHRWGWLLMLGTNSPSSELKKWGIEVMCDWFSEMRHERAHLAWESYSVSERIINSIFFLYHLRDFSYDGMGRLDDLEENLIESALFLGGHLEFKGDSTNNHILNNARALYVLGRMASCEGLAEIGRQIFIEETPKMITPSGFLREGSSNYHMLLLRTYLEVLWVAEQGEDRPFAEMIKPVATSMLRAAWFFNVYNQVENRWNTPLIGDVSPDFSPEWLENICRSRLALKLYKPFECETDFSTGWNRMWKNEKPD